MVHTRTRMVILCVLQEEYPIRHKSISSRGDINVNSLVCVKKVSVPAVPTLN